MEAKQRIEKEADMYKHEFKKAQEAADLASKQERKQVALTTLNTMSLLLTQPKEALPTLGQ
eukprot:1038310-Prymnesium_polylepis.1